MNFAGLVTILLGLGAVLFLCAALHDVAFRTVPNWVSGLLVACGLVLRLLQHDLAWGVGCGAIVFSIAYILWRFGFMGGADVKLLGAAAVFVAPGLVPTMLIATSFAGGGISLLYLIVGRLVRWRRRGHYGAKPRHLLRRILRCELYRLAHFGPLPYAAAIAVGGWISITVS